MKNGSIEFLRWKEEGDQDPLTPSLNPPMYIYMPLPLSPLTRTYTRARARHRPGMVNGLTVLNFAVSQACDVNMATAGETLPAEICAKRDTESGQTCRESRRSMFSRVTVPRNFKVPCQYTCIPKTQVGADGYMPWF